MISSSSLSYSNYILLLPPDHHHRHFHHHHHHHYHRCRPRHYHHLVIIIICRWAQIAKHLPGRTDNEVKNFWNSTIKKKLISRAFDVLDFPSSNNPVPTAGELIGALAHPSDLIGATQESFFFFPHSDGREMEIKMDLPLHSVDFERMTTLVQTQAFPYGLSFPYQTPDAVNGQEMNVNPAISENSRIMNSLELASVKGIAEAEESYRFFPCFPIQGQACNLHKLTDQTVDHVEKLLGAAPSLPPSAPISYGALHGNSCSVIW